MDLVPIAQVELLDFKLRQKVDVKFNFMSCISSRAFLEKIVSGVFFYVHKPKVEQKTTDGTESQTFFLRVVVCHHSPPPLKDLNELCFSSIRSSGQSPGWPSVAGLVFLAVLKHRDKSVSQRHI